MSLGLNCKIQVKELEINNARKAMNERKKNIEKNTGDKLKKLRDELDELKKKKKEQDEKRITGLPSQAQLAKRKRVNKAKLKKNTK